MSAFEPIATPEQYPSHSPSLSDEKSFKLIPSLCGIKQLAHAFADLHDWLYGVSCCALLTQNSPDSKIRRLPALFDAAVDKGVEFLADVGVHGWFGVFVQCLFP